MIDWQHYWSRFCQFLERQYRLGTDPDIQQFSWRNATVTRSEQCFVCEGRGWLAELVTLSLADSDIHRGHWAISPCPVCDSSGFAVVERPLRSVMNEEQA